MGWATLWHFLLFLPLVLIQLGMIIVKLDDDEHNSVYVWSLVAVPTWLMFVIVWVLEVRYMVDDATDKEARAYSGYHLLQSLLLFLFVLFVCLRADLDWPGSWPVAFIPLWIAFFFEMINTVALERLLYPNLWQRRRLHVLFWELTWTGLVLLSIFMVTDVGTWPVKLIPLWGVLAVWALFIVHRMFLLHYYDEATSGGAASGTSETFDEIYLKSMEEFHRTYHYTWLHLVLELVVWIGLTITSALLANYLEEVVNDHHHSHSFGTLTDPTIVFAPLIIALVLVFFVAYFVHYFRERASPQHQHHHHHHRKTKPPYYYPATIAAAAAAATPSAPVATGYSVMF